jgi:hypothetical protein
MGKKTVSYTVGTDLSSEIKVEHDLNEVTLKKKTRYPSVAHVQPRARRRPQPKVTNRESKKSE